ncbi:hypothetical protein P7K49_003946 [Saguinus oedipus]|uniref:Uncharacterized protein n=1 Tax=Saguinus oedipus TaxID=9490 RepID=A0ABQ9W6N9_SAGOE|nr:hypothetical protein P7K49_003946 [Saguinus oedipus]
MSEEQALHRPRSAVDTPRLPIGPAGGAEGSLLSIPAVDWALPHKPIPPPGHIGVVATVHRGSTLPE